MKDFLISAKHSAVFVGTVIGAGFATGEEIKLYFSGCSILSVVISALVFSSLLALFLYVGKIGFLKIKRFTVVLRIIKVGAVLISVIAMGAAAEDVVWGILGIKGGGVLTLVATFTLALSGSKSLGIVNSIAVPLIVVFIVCIFIRVDTGVDISGKTSIVSAVGYASMNIFCGGMVVSRSGKEMSSKQIWVSSGFTFLAVSTLMVCIKLCIGSGVGSMPLVGVARNVGLETVAEVVVYLAVFTTMLSNVSLIYRDVKKVLRYDLGVLVFLVFTVTLSLKIGFSQIVQTGYPVVSFCGVAYVIYALVSLVLQKSFFNKCDDGVHASG